MNQIIIPNTIFSTRKITTIAVRSKLICLGWTDGITQVMISGKSSDLYLSGEMLYKLLKRNPINPMKNANFKLVNLQLANKKFTNDQSIIMSNLKMNYYCAINIMPDIVQYNMYLALAYKNGKLQHSWIQTNNVSSRNAAVNEMITNWDSKNGSQI